MNLFQGIPHHVLLENPIFVPVSMAFEPSFIVRRLGKLLFKDAGFYLSGCCIWKKNSLVLGRSPYQWIHEPCLYGWKQKDPLRQQRVPAEA